MPALRDDRPRRGRVKPGARWRQMLPPPGAPDVLYLIDLSGYVFRAYHAIAPLSNSKGEPTHATYGTVAMLQKLVSERKPAYLASRWTRPARPFARARPATTRRHAPRARRTSSLQMQRSREIVEAYASRSFSATASRPTISSPPSAERAVAAGLCVVIVGARQGPDAARSTTTAS